ncbi:MAG TPA: ABC transporter permease [Bryobacteraceae bacterium]|nr:ABC transporter permease [Bryobacteraceae bacterium]
MLRNELIYAFRTLRRNPVFAIAAVVTIALAIGASTAVFSVMNAVLLRPLPYKDPARLVLACGDLRRRNVKDFPLSNADYLDLRNGARSAFEDFAAVSTFRATLPGIDGTPEEFRGAAVSTNFFRVMGGGIAMGRDFQDSDGTPEPAPPAAAAGAPPPAPRLPVMTILSYEYFQRRFGGDRSVIGKPLPVAAGGPTSIVVGVLAPGFELLFPPQADIEQRPGVWLAARIPYDAENRNNVQWRVVGRLKPRVGIQPAQDEVETVAAKIRRENVISRNAGQYFRLEPMQEHLVNQVRPAILALMGAVVFLLLIACSNVANLMLVQSSLREREAAVRNALGAGWWRLVWQTVAESLVIAGLGTAAGLALAKLGIHELLRIAPANLPRLDEIHIDPVVLAFSGAAGLAAAVLFGLVPAIRAARPDLMAVLRTAGRTGALGATGWLRNVVVTAEVAMAFVLLVGSGLMVRTFVAIQKTDLGFDPHHLLTFQVFGDFGNTPQENAAWKRALRERFAGITGVRGVTAALAMPLTGGFNPIRWGRAEALADTSKFQAADFQAVLPGFFETMRIPVIAGRTFTEADSTPDRNLLIVDQALAAKAFPHESAVGKRILFRARTQEAQWGEIIGVVAHQRDISLAEPGREQIYVTDGYMNHGFAFYWALRTEGDPAGYARAVRDQVRQFGRSTVTIQLEPMDSVVVDAQAGTRFSLLLIGVFSAIAALLAAIGLYGVLSTVVRQRTAEIGVRMALGATPSRIFGLVAGQALRLSALGIVVGLLAALQLTRGMTSMLVGVRPTDPATYVSIALVFLFIAAAASWFPARRAAALDPTEALRDE